MTTEFVLILSLFAFILLGAFVGPNGPGATYSRSGPRLGALVERNLSVGHLFTRANGDERSINWSDPETGRR